MPLATLRARWRISAVVNACEPLSDGEDDDELDELLADEECISKRFLR